VSDGPGFGIYINDDGGREVVEASSNHPSLFEREFTDERFESHEAAVEWLRIYELIESAYNRGRQEVQDKIETALMEIVEGENEEAIIRAIEILQS
jgi:hypothetical protein